MICAPQRGVAVERGGLAARDGGSRRRRRRRERVKTAGVVLVEVWAKCLVAKYGDRRQLGAGLCMQYGLASEAEARLAASGTTPRGGPERREYRIFLAPPPRVANSHPQQRFRKVLHAFARPPRAAVPICVHVCSRVSACSSLTNGGVPAGTACSARPTPSPSETANGGPGTCKVELYQVGLRAQSCAPVLIV